MPLMHKVMSVCPWMCKYTTVKEGVGRGEGLICQRCQTTDSESIRSLGVASSKNCVFSTLPSVVSLCLARADNIAACS